MDLGLYAVVPGKRHGYQDLLGVPAEVADLRFLLIEAPGPLFCSIKIAGSQGRDAQGVHKHPGPETQPFLPGLLEISLRPLATGVRRAHVGVEKAQDLNRTVPAQLVLSGHHGHRPLTMSAGAGQVPGRESGVCQAPQAPADDVLETDSFRHPERFLERASHRAGIVLKEIADRQRGQRVTQRDVVSCRPRQLSRPHEHRIAGTRITQYDQSPELAESECLRSGIANRRAHFQSRGGGGLRAGKIAKPERQKRQLGQGESPFRGRLRRGGAQALLCRRHPLRQSPPHPPVQAQCSYHGPGIVWRAGAAIVDGRPQIG
jgi:hypothetical protein